MRDDAFQLVVKVIKDLWSLSPDDLMKIKECTDTVSFVIGNELKVRKERNEL
jgi:hypothetical protein